jgi:type I restriction-modification system DNA methylase subunit
MPYRSLDPRTELEQTVAADLEQALSKRGCEVKHHGTGATPAPATAPCDISVKYGGKTSRRTMMVEVAQRVDASELQSIIAHLDQWIATTGTTVDLLYSGRSTSARMARLVRNENERREALGLPGRILFLKLDDLEAFLQRWKALPAEEAPAKSLRRVFDRHRECADDLSAAQVFRDCLFPEWEEKQKELEAEAIQRLAIQQERLKKDIQKLENKLREMGVTGPRAHKFLIYLFFMALYEDKRGKDTRATKQGFLAYREGLSNAAKNNSDFKSRAVHHLLSQEILEDPDVKEAGIPTQYEKIDLSDEFVLKEVIPIFENYSFADAAIDAIGAVFEALARRAEKDNRIGQFFTPETAVAATCRLAGLRPTDLVADPACGTGRFLIRAMADMVAQADAVTGKSKGKALEDIKQKLLLGCDIDPWIAIIAKMNMYIHGDGKSNIRRANGLTLATMSTFAPQRPMPLAGALDVVLTNPPLGDINFVAIAEQVAREQAIAAGGTEDPAEIEKRGAVWSQANLAVVPHAVIEEEIKAKAEKKADEWREKAIAAKDAGDSKAEAKARKLVKEWDEKRIEAAQAIGAGAIHYRPSGNTSKGGALFLSAMVHCLKKVRDASLPVEWRGGVIGLIIDEAVLNTREYASAREFIRRQYFIKAIVSLPRDAFAELAKTTAKTSILLLIRKDDPAVVQREPVFFARADRTGATANDVKRANDLVPICDSFDAWRDTILSRCRTSGSLVPNVAAITAAMKAARSKAAGIGQIAGRSLDPSKPQERLDEAYWCMKELVASIPSPRPLSDLADLISEGRVPPEQDAYAFASVVRIEGRVRPKGETATSYSIDALQEVKAGDILVSGIDLVHGSVGVVGADCNGMAVSKEYFILRAKEGSDAHWLVSLLRTKSMRRIIEGTITGTSNRTRIESPDVLMALPVPPSPSKAVQKMVGDALRSAHKHHAQMIENIREAEAKAAAAAALPSDFPPDVDDVSN